MHVNSKKMLNRIQRLLHDSLSHLIPTETFLENTRHILGFILKIQQLHD